MKPSRFHNFTDSALGDEIGRVDAIMEAADAELAALKADFKARGLTDVSGDSFTVTATEQIAGRLDTKAVREFLGASYSRFELAVISTVVRVTANRHPCHVSGERPPNRRQRQPSPGLRSRNGAACAN